MIKMRIFNKTGLINTTLGWSIALLKMRHFAFVAIYLD
jgi:hypothetical protein